MFDVVTVGHFAIDFVTSPKRTTPKPTLGGPPTYVSLAAEALGAKVAVVSKVGGDFPARYVRWLKNRRIDVSALHRVRDAHTTSYILKYDESGQRQLILRNRAPTIEAEDIPGSLEAKAVHIGPIANEVSREAIARLRSLAGLISMDPQGFLRRFGKDGTVQLGRMQNPEVLREVDVFKASQKETESAFGEADLAQSMRKIHEQGVRTVIATRGQEGSLLYVEGKLYSVPASKPRVIADMTGAGDVFIGAFLAEYIRGKDPVWCASVGSAQASFVIEQPGPKGFGSKKEVYDRAAGVYEEASLLACF